MFKVSCIQLRSNNDIDYNLKRTKRWILKAVKQKTDFILTPEVSSIYDFIGPDRNIPWIKKRTSTTTIRVRDNETIVIAGLVTTEEVEVRSKVPVLWRIPIIGKRWFSHNEISEKKTDLIIQVKPTIVVDNYSGIDKKEYHIDAEESMINE